MVDYFRMLEIMTLKKMVLGIAFKKCIWFDITVCFHPTSSASRNSRNITWQNIANDGMNNLVDPATQSLDKSHCVRGLTWRYKQYRFIKRFSACDSCQEGGPLLSLNSLINYVRLSNLVPFERHNRLFAPRALSYRPPTQCRPPMTWLYSKGYTQYDL